MSRTYQQTSRSNPDLDRRDPTNTWLARQGRFRLDAEMVRDNALAISGLLSLRMGGPTVKPYQPAGYWDYLNFPTRQWQDDHGENQYRRGLYTFWQRTFLHPSLLAFDASTREECTVDRARSNTPLQALVVLNDPTYVEAAKVFAAQDPARRRPHRGREIAVRLSPRNPAQADRRGSQFAHAALSSAPGPVPGRSCRRRRTLESRRHATARRRGTGRTGGLDLRGPSCTKSA